MAKSKVRGNAPRRRARSPSILKKYPIDPAISIAQKPDAARVMEITATHCRSFSKEEAVLIDPTRE
jgi:hypothetical protein